jgi:folate-binding Fe-S cluster repair protein YgfZ
MTSTGRLDLDPETDALRHGAGAFRAGRDIVSVRGPDAEAYLQGQLSQDVAAPRSTRCCSSRTASCRRCYG